jgi:hypothetical protein
MSAGGVGQTRDSSRLRPRQAQGELARRFVGLGRLVDIGGKDAIRGGADLLQQIKAARAGAGEDQDGGPSAGYLNR